MSSSSVGRARASTQDTPSLCKGRITKLLGIAGAKSRLRNYCEIALLRFGNPSGNKSVDVAIPTKSSSLG